MRDLEGASGVATSAGRNRAAAQKQAEGEATAQMRYRTYATNCNLVLGNGDRS
jgi:hypothetical protein